MMGEAKCIDLSGESKILMNMHLHKALKVGKGEKDEKDCRRSFGVV